MYVDVGGETTTLRQGDIIRRIQVLGTIKYELVTVPTANDQIQDWTPNSWTVQSPPRYRDCMVLSHCCELDRSNRDKVTGVILAPLRNIHEATRPDKVEELIESNDIRGPGVQASFLKYFYVEAHPELEASDGAIVDFSKCFSVRNTGYDYLCANKLLQLTDCARTSMSLKLALYFYRSSIDDLVAA